jgi:hypothetical protein
MMKGGMRHRSPFLFSDKPHRPFVCVMVMGHLQFM